MQYISDEFNKVLSQRLKVGGRHKPQIRVEIDRLAFIPGRCTQLEFIKHDIQSVTRVEKTWIEPTSTGSVEAETTINQTGLVFPVQGKDLSIKTSEYGMRDGSFHKGVDLATTINTPLLACWSGVVTVATTKERNTNWGYYVVINHGNGYFTKYGHMNRIDVSVGDKVVAGQQIGLMGNTGQCYSQGELVTEAMRPSGRGSHLHLEVWINCGDKVKEPQYEGGTHVDPLPYLQGTKSIPGGAVTIGAGVKTDGVVEGYKGSLKFSEYFKNSTWYSGYKLKDNFKCYHAIAKKGTTSYASFIFNPTNVKKDTGSLGTVKTVTFEKEIVMTTEGVLSFDVFGTFTKADNDGLSVYVDGKMVVNYKDFKTEPQTVSGIAVPKGTIKIKFDLWWGGKYGGNPSIPSKSIAIGNMEVRELNANPSQSTSQQLAGEGYWEDVTVEDFIFNNKKETVELQVGDFVYNDTLILENVQSCEVNSSLEQECTEVSLTVSNPEGFYSPDYQAYNFPELYHSSPWSYRINDMQIGVLSENTPIRIYMGYGLNMVRVFTGLIDKVDMVGADGMMTITARDMYKKVITKVLTEEKAYPKDYVELTETTDLENPDEYEKVAWLKTAVVQDLIEHAGMYNWRACAEDLLYPDAVVEESYLIEVNQATGKVIKALPDKEYGFEVVEISSIPTPQGWLNPYVEEFGKKFDAFTTKVGDCITDVLQDTNYRSYCDRYGTYRLEQLDYQKPVVASFTDNDNLITINKSVDYTRGRSHILVQDEDGNYANFVDKEMIIELKGEVRTAVVVVKWAKTEEQKKTVAERMFYDMKRLCRSLSVTVPGNPNLDLLDRITISDKSTATKDTYCIKGLKHSFNADGGFLTVLELTWSREGTVV